MATNNAGPAVTTTPNIVTPTVTAGATAVPFDPSNVAIGGGTIRGTGWNEFYGFSGQNTKKWRAALARTRVGGTRAKIACVGDSTTRGMGSGSGDLFTGTQANSYPTQLAALLNARGLPAQANSLFGNGATTITTSDPRVTLGAGWAAGGTLLGGSLLAGTAATGFLGLQPSVSVDTFDTYYVAGGLGTATLNINGGATLATLDGSGASNILKNTVTGSLAANQLRVTYASGSAFWVAGIDAYNSAAKEVAVWNLGASGAKVADVRNAGSGFSFAFCLPKLAPDLTIIDLTINDWAPPTNLASYTADMQALIAAALSTGDVILMTGVPSSTSSATAVNQAAFVSANYDLAKANGIPLIDLSYRWTDYTTSNALGMYYDSLHPSARGYSDVAQSVANVLLNLG